MMLTANFSSEEICGSHSFQSMTPYRQNMVQKMAELLQTIRDYIGKPITINSGVRNASDYERLKRSGSNPSKTSDHFFGDNIDGYQASAGACDIVCPSIDTIEFFNIVLEMRYLGYIQTGQLLLEKNNSYWVHIANDPELVVSPELLAQRNEWSRHGIGYSLNNGKSFTHLAWGEYYGTKQEFIGNLSALKTTVKDNAPIIIAATVIIGGIATVIVINNNRKRQEAADYLLKNADAKYALAY